MPKNPATERGSAFPLAIATLIAAVSIGGLVGTWAFVGTVLLRSAPQSQNHMQAVRVEQTVVDQGPLTRRKVVTATAQPHNVELTLPPGIITSTPIEDGTQVESTAPLLEVNGQPVFALDTPFGLWRDIEPGIDGKDVLELRAALARQGFIGDNKSSRYDRALARGIERLHKRASYKPSLSSSSENSAAQDSTVSSRAPEPILKAWQIASTRGMNLTLDLGESRRGDRTEGASSPPRLIGGARSLIVSDNGSLAKEVASMDGSPVTAQLVTGDSDLSVSYPVQRVLHENDASVLYLEDAPPQPTTQVSVIVVLDKTATDVLHVPKIAVRLIDGESYVRVTEEGNVRDISVDLGFDAGSKIQVMSPELEPGMHVELP